jgi:pimeloyl-ACP methyl ester carboxylesterase
MEKVRIKNRQGLTITVGLDLVPNQKGLAFVAHGLAVWKDQPQLETIKDALNENGYSVVRWDATNAMGESDGKMEDATVTGYYEDMEDVMAWSRKQEWYAEPFILAGCSLGGLITTLYAENHPQKVKALAPISSAISYQFMVERIEKEKLKKWKRDGIKSKLSLSKPGVIKSLKWNFMVDLEQYDALKKISKLTMPVLLIVGEKDTTTPPHHQKVFFDAMLHTRKELHIAKGCPHMFLASDQLAELKKPLMKWLKKLD